MGVSIDFVCMHTRYGNRLADPVTDVTIGEIFGKKMRAAEMNVSERRHNTEIALAQVIIASSEKPKPE